MQIGQVTRHTGLSVDAIRFYERRSLLPKPPRTAGRFRLYSGDDVARLDFIKRMQHLGFSLQEVRQLLDLRTRRDACHEVKDLLKTKLDGVRSKILRLKLLEGELALDLRKCNRELRRQQKGAARGCPILSAPNGKTRGTQC